PVPRGGTWRASAWSDRVRARRSPRRPLGTPLGDTVSRTSAHDQRTGGGDTMGRWRAAGLLALALALLGACHDVEQTRTLRPKAVVEGGPLDFGEVPVGEWREATLRIRNVGFTSVNVREVLAL